MTLYRCAYQSESNTRGVLMHRVQKDPEGKWVRAAGVDTIGKLIYNEVVLKLEVARLTSPFISINWDERRTSEYHICLYHDYTVAISDEKWSKFFVPIETKTEQ